MKEGQEHYLWVDGDRICSRKSNAAEWWWKPRTHSFNSDMDMKTGCRWTGWWNAPRQIWRGNEGRKQKDATVCISHGDHVSFMWQNVADIISVRSLKGFLESGGRDKKRWKWKETRLRKGVLCKLWRTFGEKSAMTSLLANKSEACDLNVHCSR